MGTLEDFSSEVKRSFFPMQTDQQVYVDAIAYVAADENEKSTGAIQIALNDIIENKKNLGHLFFSLSVKARYEQKTPNEKELFRECQGIMNHMAGLEVPTSHMSLPFICSLMELDSGEAFNKMEELHNKLINVDNHAKLLITKWKEIYPECPLTFDMRPRVKLDPLYAREVTEPVISRQIHLFTNIIGLTLQIADVDDEMNHFWHAKKIVELIVRKSNSQIEDVHGGNKLDLLCKRIDRVGAMYLQIMTEICEDISFSEIVHVFSRNQRDSFSSCRTIDNGYFFGLLNEYGRVPDISAKYSTKRYFLLPPSAWRYSLTARLYELVMKTELILKKSFQIETDLERKLSFILHVAKELDPKQNQVLQPEYLMACSNLLESLKPRTA